MRFRATGVRYESHAISTTQNPPPFTERGFVVRAQGCLFCT